MQSPEAKNDFGQFLNYFEKTLVDEPVDRGWIWDDYRSFLNQLAYRRLFLHELPGHPDVTLPDLYVPSRGTSFERQDEGNDLRRKGKKSNQKDLLHAFDISEHLIKHWLTADANKVGHSRLVTGDPGAGKSTFSLMLANSLA